MRVLSIVFVLIFACFTAAWGMEAKIVRLSGEVKIRRGIEEVWHPAAVEMILKEIDTITTGEGGEVLLQIDEGPTFRLGANAILDIADLKKITEQELFLYLTRQKVDQLKPGKGRRPLRTGNVSAVHGEDKSADQTKPEHTGIPWTPETNGAKALLEQAYYTNAILKLHKIAQRYPAIEKCREFHCSLGQAFEALNEPGQAIDAYETALAAENNGDCSESDDWEQAAQEGLKRLKE